VPSSGRSSEGVYETTWVDWRDVLSRKGRSRSGMHDHRDFGKALDCGRDATMRMLRADLDW
jgi:hypothetical protein